MGRDLESVFAGLGLTQYINAFTDQGFDSWETILDIQESDLYVTEQNSPDRTHNSHRDTLGVKLGHRRVSYSSTLEALMCPSRNYHCLDDSEDQALMTLSETSETDSQRSRPHPRNPSSLAYEDDL